jgi:hypothetical protein
MNRENLNRRRHYLDETPNCAVQEALNHFWTLGYRRRYLQDNRWMGSNMANGHDKWRFETSPREGHEKQGCIPAVSEI